MRLMRTLVMAGVAAIACASPAMAQATKCPDLAMTTVKQVGSIPGEAPLASGEIAFIWSARNVGRVAYVSPRDSLQWIAFELPPATSALVLQVLPPAGPGGDTPVNIVAGQTLHGYVRATPPAGTPRSGVVRARIKYVAGAGGDCSDANNERRGPYRLR